MKPNLAHLPNSIQEEIRGLVERLSLEPHPEGGAYRETWRGQAIEDGGRGVGTAIFFLLPEGVENRWHRVDAAEIWHHYAGGPLELSICEEGGPERRVILGDGLHEGETPQAVVPPGAWQQAKALRGYALCGCTVAPAFLFERFELAPPGWRPGG